MSETRALRLARQGGWRAEAIESLGRLASMSTPRAGPRQAEDRGRGLHRRDGRRPARRVGPIPIQAWHLSFSADGKTLAVNDVVGNATVLGTWRRCRGGDGSPCFALGPALRPGGPIWPTPPRATGSSSEAGPDGPGHDYGPRPGGRVCDRRHRPTARRRMGGGEARTATPCLGEPGIDLFEVGSGDRVARFEPPFGTLVYKAALALEPRRPVRWRPPATGTRSTSGRSTGRAAGRPGPATGLNRGPDLQPRRPDLASASRGAGQHDQGLGRGRGVELLSLHGHTTTVWGVASAPTASCWRASPTTGRSAALGRPHRPAPAGHPLAGGTGLAMAFAPAAGGWPWTGSASWASKAGGSAASCWGTPTRCLDGLPPAPARGRDVRVPRDLRVGRGHGPPGPRAGPDRPPPDGGLQPGWPPRRTDRRPRRPRHRHPVDTPGDRPGRPRGRPYPAPDLAGPIRWINFDGAAGGSRRAWRTARRRSSRSPPGGSSAASRSGGRSSASP